MDGESWKIQCEVLQHHHSEEGPPEEDPVPEDVNFENGVPFDFFGLGQPVLGANNQDDQNLNQEQDPAQNAWDPWPAEIQAQEQPVKMDVDPMHAQDLNEPPIPEQNAGLDLNHPPLDIDLHPVILNPVLPEENANFLELNDLQNNMMEQHLLQLENEVFLVNPAEEELMELADELQQDLNQNLPSPSLPS